MEFDPATFWATAQQLNLLAMEGVSQIWFFIHIHYLQLAPLTLRFQGRIQLLSDSLGSFLDLRHPPASFYHIFFIIFNNLARHA